MMAAWNHYNLLGILRSNLWGSAIPIHITVIAGYSVDRAESLSKSV